jgi:hypothetical protein
MAHDTTAEVVFAGREGALSLQFDADDALPAGVRCIAITLTFGPLSGKVSTVLGLDAVRVRDELALALASTDLTGRTRFASVEGDLRVGLDLRHGKGTIVIHLAPSFGREEATPRSA